MSPIRSPGKSKVAIASSLLITFKISGQEAILVIRLLISQLSGKYAVAKEPRAP